MFHLVFAICVLLCHTWTCAQGSSGFLVLPGGLLYVESQGSLEACVVLSETNVTGSDVTVNLTTVDGTAQAPADYESVDESFTFSPTSNTTMCVNITINDDGFPEIIETLSILLTLDGVTADSATVKIKDDDGATVSLSASLPTNFTVTEGDSGDDTDVQFCVQLDDDGSGLERDILLFIVPLNQNKMGSARSGDYQTSQILTIPSSTAVGNSVCQNITIIGDDIAEADETLTITVSVANSNDVINGSDIITVTILDNDAASVSLVEPTSFTVTEEDSGSNTDEEFCVQIDRVLERDIPLSFSFGGSAGSDDYQTNPTLTILPSTAVGNSVCHQITIIGDDIVEGDETLTITVSVANSKDVITGSDVVTVTILDNDELVNCGTLMNPMNGQVNFTDTTLGADATYTCDEGLALEGVDTRTCEADGEWSDSEPICGAEIAQISLLVTILLVTMGLAIVGF